MALAPAPLTPAPSRDAAPSSSLRRVRWAALGTQCEVQYCTRDAATAAAFEAAAVGWVNRFEARCTRFRDTSFIGQINRAAGSGAWIPIDDEMERIFDVCASIFQMTRGILDVTSAPLARLWDYRVPTPRIPSDAEIAATRSLVGWPQVERRPGAVRLPRAGMAIDLGGWGKEYAVDAVADLARNFGIEGALVDIGHDLRATGAPAGRPAWHVGLENPNQPGQSAGSIAIRQEGVASSGDYLRSFMVGGQRFGHILDVRTGWPVTNGSRQVTVVAPNCLMAGVLATTAFILGPQLGTRLVEETMGAQVRIVAKDAVYQSRGFFQYVVT